jgi:hypothetical protein
MVFSKCCKNVANGREIDGKVVKNAIKARK